MLVRSLGRLSALALLTLVRLLRLLGLCRLGRAPLTFHFLAGDRRGLGPPPTCPLSTLIIPHSANLSLITCRTINSENTPNRDQVSRK